MFAGVARWTVRTAALKFGRLPSSTAKLEWFVTQRESCGTVLFGGVPMLQPCDPDTTISLLRHVLSSRPEDVNLELVFDLVAQLVTDLHAWPYDE